MLKSFEDINTTKPPKTYSEQLKILKSRNLKVIDDEFAIEVLKYTNYYRLSGYSLSLKQQDDLFLEGSTFEDVYRLYLFDEQFRHLLVRPIQCVEISFRTHIAYELAHKYGPDGYLKSENFDDPLRHEGFLFEVEKEIKRQKEPFVRHHLIKKGGYFPIWVAIELLTFTTLSMLYKNMKMEDRQKISHEYYDVKPEFVENWLYTLSYVRNICAHYGRLYNKQLTIKPKLFQQDRKLGVSNDKIFSVLVVLNRLVKNRILWNKFVEDLASLINEFDDVLDLDLIGFHKNWFDLLTYRSTDNAKRGLN